MRTANIDTAPSQWGDIVGWIGAGEEVELRRENRAIAKVVPLLGGVETQPVVWPDFVSRARAIWGENNLNPSLVEALLREREERG